VQLTLFRNAITAVSLAIRSLATRSGTAYTVSCLDQSEQRNGDSITPSRCFFSQKWRETVCLCVRVWMLYAARTFLPSRSSSSSSKAAKQLVSERAAGVSARVSLGWFRDYWRHTCRLQQTTPRRRVEMAPDWNGDRRAEQCQIIDPASTWRGVTWWCTWAPTTK